MKEGEIEGGNEGDRELRRVVREVRKVGRERRRFGREIHSKMIGYKFDKPFDFWPIHVRLEFDTNQVYIRRPRDQLIGWQKVLSCPCLTQNRRTLTKSKISILIIEQNIIFNIDMY